VIRKGPVWRRQIDQLRPYDKRYATTDDEGPGEIFTLVKETLEIEVYYNFIIERGCFYGPQ